MSVPLSVLICVSVIQLCLGVEETITTRHVPLLGGWNKVENATEDPNVQDAAHSAVKLFNTHSKAHKMFTLVNITSAKVQVTNVVNYEIGVILRKTKCLKSENHTLATCELAKKQLQCTFRLTHNPRNNKHEVVTHNCHKIKRVHPSL